MAPSDMKLSLTLETPKPLIKVNGVRMIDTIIRGLHANGITEIYVVVGYLKEKFSELPSEYPGLTLIENPYWDTCNNISSLYCAREHLDDCIILDGDQMIYNAGILSREFGLFHRITSPGIMNRFKKNVNMMMKNIGLSPLKINLIGTLDISITISRKTAEIPKPM